MYRFYQKTSLLIISIVLICVTAQASQPVPSILYTDNLQVLAQKALQQKLPIMLYIASPNCKYCTLLEDEILLPMLIRGDYEQKIILRKIMLNNDQDLIDFSGKTLNIKHLAENYKLKLTPTLLFLNHHGHEIEERMVGINTPEFYAAYLEQNINKARLAIQD